MAFNHSVSVTELESDVVTESRASASACKRSLNSTSGSTPEVIVDLNIFFVLREAIIAHSGYAALVVPVALAAEVAVALAAAVVVALAAADIEGPPCGVPGATKRMRYTEPLLL